MTLASDTAAAPILPADREGGAEIIGAEALGEREKTYLTYADRFEREFISQGEDEKRKVEDTLDTGWNLLSALPEEDLKLVSEEFIKKYHPRHRGI